jgi:dihydroorotate dehydrogenase (NAD+) catalytic subunit
VASAQDVLEYLAAGASVVAVGTALFRDPQLPRRILADLAGLIADRGLTSVADVVNAAHDGHRKALPQL